MFNSFLSSFSPSSLSDRQLNSLASFPSTYISFFSALLRVAGTVRAKEGGGNEGRTKGRGKRRKGEGSTAARPSDSSVSERLSGTAVAFCYPLSLTLPPASPSITLLLLPHHRVADDTTSSIQFVGVSVYGVPSVCRYPRRSVLLTTSDLYLPGCYLDGSGGSIEAEDFARYPPSSSPPFPVPNLIKCPVSAGTSVMPH